MSKAHPDYSRTMADPYKALLRRYRPAPILRPCGLLSNAPAPRPLVTAAFETLQERAKYSPLDNR